MKQASSQLKSVPSLDEDDISSQRLPFSVGAWIETWFPSHQKYYCGKLTKQRDHDCWQVEYLDGSCQWMLLSKERICVIAAADSLAAKDYDERRRLLAHLKIGSRVEVFWEPYDTWFSGTVKQIKSGMEEEYLIAYDIKNETWESLFSETFRLLGNAMIGTEQAAPLSDDTAAPESFSAGARIAVFFSDDQGGQFYPGTVTTGNVNSKGEINVAFDDGEVLDLVLAEEEYKILPDQSKKRKLASDNSNDGVTSLCEDVGQSAVLSSIHCHSRTFSRDGKSLPCIPIEQD
ncbi:hypothetical protein MPSEU_000670000 [Mayamaea pseudoterrestris]|nr:hypothetical protein MPSEU_000670000 [Mayamaea pseudoterrestris]